MCTYTGKPVVSQFTVAYNAQQFTFSVLDKKSSPTI